MCEGSGDKGQKGWFFISRFSKWVSGDLSANAVTANAETTQRGEVSGKIRGGKAAMAFSPGS